MSQTFNPFEHHHDHGPEGHVPPEPLERQTEVDPGQRALADALRVTFGILKIVMLVLVAIYLFSGAFIVPERTQAVYLRFGQIVGPAGKQVLAPGWYFGWPFPVGQVVRLTTSKQQLEIDHDFWFDVPKGAAEGKTLDEEGKKGPLNPELDGSMITGDANILHARWSVTYQVVDPVAFIQNVKSDVTARTMIQDVVEEAAVYAMAQTRADVVFQGNPPSALIKQRAQERLSELGGGLAIESVQARKILFPFAVRDAFAGVANAQSYRDQAMTQARAKAAGTLGSAAGEASEALVKLLDDYEVIQRGSDEKAKADADARIKQVFTNLEVPGPQGVLKISGEAARSISQARSDRVNLVEQVRGEAETFRKLLPGYQQAPSVQLTLWWAEAREEIFSGKKNNVHLIPAGPLVIDINRDPVLVKQRNDEAREAGAQPVIPTR